MEYKGNSLKNIMFVGTGSSVGKSLITAAMGRILKNDGFNPAPFKAQNMALNSFVTKDNLEIGRAQAVQAKACGLEPVAEMNPLLLKPSGENLSQLVILGKPAGNYMASEYYFKKGFLWGIVVKSFKKLASIYNPIVIEGAGSISELNLKDKDIVNIPVAKLADAATFLVADIDKGGVIGSVYGNISLLPDDERKLIKGVIINKFRGDKKLFEDGKKIIHDLTNIPVVGVIPYFRDIYIDEEDSESSFNAKNNTNGRINVAVVMLKHISNFTDFAPFKYIDEVNFYYATTYKEILDADITIIPGSKNVIDDLIYLKNSQLDRAIIKNFKEGKTVIGICGGFEMLGKAVYDEKNVESSYSFMEGLGIFPIETYIRENKVLGEKEFYYKNINTISKGYVIHMGEVIYHKDSPLIRFTDGSFDGFKLNDRCFGTFVHGLFDNKHILEDILSPYGDVTGIDFEEFKEKELDKLAGLVKNNIDMDYIYRVMKRC